MIPEKMARQIASEWHGGQWSGLYAIASCQDYKKVPPATWHDAYWEALRAARRAAEIAASGGAKKDYKKLQKLAEWIAFTAWRHGAHVTGSLV